MKDIHKGSLSPECNLHICLQKPPRTMKWKPSAALLHIHSHLPKLFPPSPSPPVLPVMSVFLSWARCVNNSTHLPVRLPWQLQVGELAQRERHWGVLFTVFLWSASVGEHNGVVLNPHMQNRLLWAARKHFPIRFLCSCIFHERSFQNIQFVLLTDRCIIHELRLRLSFSFLGVDGSAFFYWAFCRNKDIKSILLQA